MTDIQRPAPFTPITDPAWIEYFFQLFDQKTENDDEVRRAKLLEGFELGG